MCTLQFLIVFVLVINLNLAQKSPCPKYFSFEPAKSEEDRWFSVITLQSQREVKNVTLELHFDKPVIQLGNYFGRVQPNSDSTIFNITNDKKIIKANTPTKVTIFVVYDPYYDVPPPQLTKILFNAREICPKDQDELSDDIPTITVKINVPNCGTKKINPTPLITHGQKTVQGQWPWHAALYEIVETKKKYICGGTLISDKHILTAAHCTTIGKGENLVPRDTNKVSIILGKYGTYVLGKQEQTMSVSKIIFHPNFNATNFHNDISIIVTSNPTQFTDYIKPICLWEGDISETAIVNQIGTAVGWGRDEKDNVVTDTLMEAKMPVVSRVECLLAQGTYYAEFTTEKTLCAGYRNGTSVCNGDSGGGLVFPRQGTSGIDTVWQIRGIVSNSISKPGGVCDPNYYVIFTDVAKYSDWIKQAIK